MTILFTGNESGCPIQAAFGLSGTPQHSTRPFHFGIGIDTALPAPRSATQIVSPAGSTAVGVLSPSLITVTLACIAMDRNHGNLAAAILSKK